MLGFLPWIDDGSSKGDLPVPADPDSERASARSSPYEVTERDVGIVGGEAVSAETVREGTVAGATVRHLFEDSARASATPLWVGYANETVRGFREAGLPFEALFRHLWVTGTTGYGKSTTLLNAMVQLAYGGHGFVYVDPKGEDALSLLRMLPEDRLEDVVWIEPGSERTDRTVGLNFLDVPDRASAARRETEIESRIDTLTAVFDTADYWGIDMQSITESMGRAMVQSETEFSVIDMYFVLLNATARESFAEDVEDPYVRQFCREIAGMDEETVGPLLKRMKAWIENPIVRRIIAHRESTVDFDELVANDRIVIVRTPVETPDIVRMVALGVLQHLWSAIQRRAHTSAGRPDPYFLVCDEFDQIASPRLDLEGMLARARSMRLGVTIATQYPSQLEAETLAAVQNNCDTALAFSVNARADARAVMQRFEDHGPAELVATPQYRAWTKLPLGDGRYTQPVVLDTFPPYPPLRSTAAAERAIARSLDRYGTSAPTDAEIVRNLVYGGDLDVLDGDPTVAEAMAGAVRTVQFREAERADNGWVPADAVEAVCARRLDAFHDDVEYDADAFSEVRSASDLVDGQHSPDGEGIAVRLTGRGESAATPEFGAVKSAGGPTHKSLLLDAERALSRRGFLVEITEQDNRELPDGLAVHPDTDVEYAIEAEASSHKRPARVLQNLERAQRAGRIPLFLVREGDPRGKWGKRLETILTPPERPRDDGAVRLYNYGSVITFGGGATTRGGVTAVRPRRSESNQTVWTRRGDELVLSVEGETLARVPADEELLKDALPAYYSYDTESERYTVYRRGETLTYDSTEAFEAEWVPVKEPFRLGYSLPDPEVPLDSYVLAVVSAAGELSLYRDGEVYPPDEYPATDGTWPAGLSEDVAEGSGDGSGGGGTIQTSGVAAFVDEFVREDPLQQVAKDAVFDLYLAWADANGVDATSKTWFGRRLMEHVECEGKRVREDGEVVRVYAGIELVEGRGRRRMRDCGPAPRPRIHWS